MNVCTVKTTFCLYAQSFSMRIILDTENQHFYKLYILNRKVLRDSLLSTTPREKGAPLSPLFCHFPAPPPIIRSQNLFLSAEFVSRNRPGFVAIVCFYNIYFIGLCSITGI